MQDFGNKSEETGPMEVHLAHFPGLLPRVSHLIKLLEAEHTDLDVKPLAAKHLRHLSNYISWGSGDGSVNSEIFIRRKKLVCMCAYAYIHIYVYIHIYS